jgi:plastocyanin
MSNKQLRFLTLLLTTLALGSILLVACTRPGTPTASKAKGNGSSGSSSSGSGGGTTVHLGNATFLQSSITIPKGSKLTLVDDVAVPHIIENGSWKGSTQAPAKEPGAPTVNANFAGNDTHEVGPFTTAGTFHLFCTIHPGMNLTVVVH